MKVRFHARVQSGQRTPIVYRAQRCTALCLADGPCEVFSSQVRTPGLDMLWKVHVQEHVPAGAHPCAGLQALLRCAGDAWLEGASSSSDDDDADEDYGARRRATGARASTRSGRRRSGGARPAAAAQRSRVRPWLSLAA